ncbi:uncharacterized protein LOC62_05G007403 [Vanrija pseudolonga]|uniref:Uncharacterized protein n=1 Tax=Vanrija pseudolonga TaxID=143232 RepID=A0AAF0YBU2_9TREE|nr:hypothetical protein LOC62_05G007403 [Vanrija pseudolonga]
MPYIRPEQTPSPPPFFTNAETRRWEVARRAQSLPHGAERRAAFKTAYWLAASFIEDQVRTAHARKQPQPRPKLASTALVRRALVHHGRSARANTRREVRFVTWRHIKQWGFLDAWPTSKSPLRSVLFSAGDFDDDDDNATDTESEPDLELIATPPELGLTATLVDLDDDVEMVADDEEPAAPAASARPSLKRRAENQDDEHAPEPRKIHVNHQTDGKRRRLARGKRTPTARSSLETLEPLVKALPTTTFTGPSRLSEKVVATTTPAPTPTPTTTNHRLRSSGRALSRRFASAALTGPTTPP